MSIRSYLADPARRNDINNAIRRGFLRRRMGGRAVARILVIDDDPLTRETLVRSLDRSGHEVRSATNRQQAFELCMRQVFDLIITNVSEGATEGFETIAALRRWMRDARILAVASEPAPEGRTWALSFGATRWLVKPFDVNQLLQAVDALVDGESH